MCAAVNYLFSNGKEHLQQRQYINRQYIITKKLSSQQINYTQKYTKSY